MSFTSHAFFSLICVHTAPLNKAKHFCGKQSPFFKTTWDLDQMMSHLLAISFRLADKLFHSFFWKSSNHVRGNEICFVYELSQRIIMAVLLVFCFDTNFRFAFAVLWMYLVIADCKARMFSLMKLKLVLGNPIPELPRVRCCKKWRKFCPSYYYNK